MCVSKHDQHEALQIDALKEAKCEKWFVEKVMGSRAERKGHSEVVWYCYTWGRAGDLCNFLCLYYGLSAQEVWQSIRAGRQP